ncbi:hypothetical protein DsansV1_C14g0129821 [Dioscorea sansibarensis]
MICSKLPNVFSFHYCCAGRLVYSNIVSPMAKRDNILENTACAVFICQQQWMNHSYLICINCLREPLVGKDFHASSGTVLILSIYIYIVLKYVKNVLSEVI